MSLSKLLITSPVGSIPRTNTKPRKLLLMLAEGEPVLEQTLASIFLSNQRSPIQALGGDQFNHWNIKPILDGAGVIVARQLDPRHLSGKPKLDAEARLERRKTLKEISARKAAQGRRREQRAMREMTEAQRDYFLSLGEAANDEPENKKPLSK